MDQFEMIYPDCEDLKLQFQDLIERNGLSHTIHTEEDTITITVTIDRDFRHREHMKKRWAKHGELSYAQIRASFDRTDR